MDEQPKLGRTFWTAVLLIATLLGYPLSAGPLLFVLVKLNAWNFDFHYIVPVCHAYFYPLQLLTERFDFMEESFGSYVDFWVALANGT